MFVNMILTHNCTLQLIKNTENVEYFRYIITLQNILGTLRMFSMPNIPFRCFFAVGHDTKTLNQRN